VDSDPNTKAVDIAVQADERGPCRKAWIRPLIEECNIAETEIVAKAGVVAEGGSSIS
jgi:hypothetical protein